MAVVTGEMVGTTGRVGNNVYYQKGGKTYVRKATTNSNRDMTSPNMVRVAENNAEFKQATQWSKALRLVTKGLSRGTIAGALSAELLAIAKQYDTTSTRGQRSIKDADAQGLAVLKGFELNPNTTLDSVVLGGNMDSTILPDSINVVLGDFVMNAPEGATHWAMVATAATFDKETKRVKSFSKGDATPIALTPNGEIAGYNFTTGGFAMVAGDLLFGVVSVLFFQEVNGVFYRLNEGLKNPARVIEFTTV